jgi:cytochrome c peroxidase
VTRFHRRFRAACLLTAVAAFLPPAAPGWAQEAEGVEVELPLGSLRGLKPPAPPAAEYDALVKDKNWLVALGKALYWDSSVGSDGQACASCHFHAGADPRLVNQLSSGLLNQPYADDKWGGIGAGAGLTRGGLLGGTGKKAGANMKLEAGDFPFHQLADVNDRNSAVLYETNDAVSSQGSFDGTLLSVSRQLRFRTRTRDFCVAGQDDIFQTVINGVVRQVRKVAPRNSPTVINAAYNYRNFWDGRANNVFNGVGVFGRRETQADPAARIVALDAAGSPGLQALELPNMSLASQAAGPPNSSVEMACASNSFATIGKKLLTQTALAGQAIDANDGVFGNLSAVGNQIRGTGKGLKQTYRMLVQKAFEDHLWAGTGTHTISPQGQLLAGGTTGYTQDELNFSLFFGMAIDAYERTLISDQTKFDRHAEGNANALSAKEKLGRQLFEGKGRCTACHGGPLFTNAASPPRQRRELVENMVMGDGAPALYDGGFYNIGVRPTHEDVGVGGKDPFGNPLSFTRQYAAGKKVDSFPNPAGGMLDRVAVDGAFKTPTLRNVALTAPYFHNGGEATLKGVVEFYNRGGNRRDLAGGGDTTGTGPNGQGAPVGPNMGGSNLDADIRPLGLTGSEVDALVAFMKALTDQRVACHAAPFDHPELVLPNGHVPDTARGRAKDGKLRLLPVGRGGYGSALCDPNTGDLFARNLVGGMLQPVP